MKLRLDGHVFARDPQVRLAVDQTPSERSLRLVSDEDDVIVRIPYSVLEVMDDASAGAHPASGEDDRIPHLVDRLRFLHP